MKISGVFIDSLTNTGCHFTLTLEDIYNEIGSPPKFWLKYVVIFNRLVHFTLRSKFTITFFITDYGVNKYYVSSAVTNEADIIYFKIFWIVMKMELHYVIQLQIIFQISFWISFTFNNIFYLPMIMQLINVAYHLLSLLVLMLCLKLFWHVRKIELFLYELVANIFFHCCENIVESWNFFLLLLM